MNNAQAQIEADEDAKELRQLIEESASDLQRANKRAWIVGSVFIACVFTTFLFTTAGPWNAHWEPFGRIATILSMITLTPAVITAGQAWNEWQARRTIKRWYMEFLEDRYGVTTK